MKKALGVLAAATLAAGGLSIATAPPAHATACNVKNASSSAQYMYVLVKGVTYNVAPGKTFSGCDAEAVRTFDCHYQGAKVGGTAFRFGCAWKTLDGAYLNFASFNIQKI